MPVISAMSGAWYGSADVSASTFFCGLPHAHTVTSAATLANERRVARIFIVPTLSLIDHGMAADRFALNAPPSPDIRRGQKPGRGARKGVSTARAHAPRRSALGQRRTSNCE